VTEPETVRPMRQDGLFKLLTWTSPALTGMFGLPRIVGDPIQQETHEPVERRLDRLYRLEDGSYLNVEHRSAIGDAAALSERMLRYRVRFRTHHPHPAVLRQVVVFTGAEPNDRRRVPVRLDYADLDPEGHGTTFRTAVKDLLTEPLATFTASGLLDDLLLGLLGPGRRDLGYRAAVARQVAVLRGEPLRVAKEKFVAVCATIGMSVDDLLGDVRMWIEDVKDSPIVQEIIEIAGQERMEQERRKTAAAIVMDTVRDRKLAVGDHLEAELVAYATEKQIRDLIGRLFRVDPNTFDLGRLLDEIGIRIPAKASWPAPMPDHPAEEP
jgi:hypothetical protein